VVKKILPSFLLLLWVWSCATYQPVKPSFYIEDLPQTIVTEFTLDERITTEEAWRNLRQDNGSRARRILTRLGVESPAYYVGLGYAFFLLGEYQASEENFKTALNYYPGMILIHLGLAQLYQNTGRENSAFTEYREVLKKNPEHSWAKKEYEALKIKKTEEALNEGSDFLAMGNRERSEEAFLIALYYSPDSTKAHLALAGIYKAEDKLQNALVHLKAASSSESENPEILKDYAETLLLTEQYAKSLEIYEQLLEMEPDNQDIQSRIENLKNRLGIFELPSQYDNISSKEGASREEMAALLAVKFKGIIDETKAKPPIIIDISTSWASKFILTTTSLGILEIYPNHTFQPQKIITRAEMTEILLRLINLLKKKDYPLLQQFPPEKIQISDVSPDNYYHNPITQIISYQIMDLDAEKAFRPEQPVSGQEAIKTLDIILSLIK
jgi:tetratricopeptide (TPR) repeat protein